MAYWRPETPLQAGQEYTLDYRQRWGAYPAPQTDLPRVVNTAMGARIFAEGRLSVIDFEPHLMFDNGPEAMTIHIQSPHAETSVGVLQRNPATGGLRRAFTFIPEDRDLVELRAVTELQQGWNAQPRCAGGFDWWVLLRFHGFETLLGFASVAGIAGGVVSWWLAPISTPTCPATAPKSPRRWGANPS